MRILFLFPYPKGTAASQRFRFEQYLIFLEKEGNELHFQSFIDARTWKVLYKKGYLLQKITGIISGFLRRTVMLFRVYGYDFVFIHREASPIGPPIFEWIIARVFHKKIIFDFDDAIWLPNTTNTNALVAGLKFHHKTAWIASWAYKISAGNAYLADYARQFHKDLKNVVVNPTTIDTQNLHNQQKQQLSAVFEKVRWDETSQKYVTIGYKDEDIPVIGWTGTHSTMKYLDKLVPVIEKLAEKHYFRFLVISNREPDFSCKYLEFRPWNKSTEINDLLELNIGLMPLSDDIWAKGKCGFKALQYMALGIPALVSPVGVNTEIVEDGVDGFICDSSEDWLNAMSRLLKEHQLRLDMGTKAREKVMAKYSVLSNQENFRGLFS